MREPWLGPLALSKVQSVHARLPVRVDWAESAYVDSDPAWSTTVVTWLVTYHRTGDRNTGGAMGIRTPDLFHAISRQPVHRSPSPQVSVPERPPWSAPIRTCCGTWLLYSFRP